MTMTMTMTMTMSHFPSRNWDRSLRNNLELIKFMEAGNIFENMDVPSVPTHAETRREIEELFEKQSVREADDRTGALIRQRILDQVETVTDFHRVMVFRAESHPATLQLMSSMVQLGTIGAMYFKNKYQRPRPSQVAPDLRAFIDVPPHASYPSGHATQAFLVAQALTTVCGNPETGEHLYHIARDVAVNREYAGVHYSSDSEAGRILAKQLFSQAERTMEETFSNAIDEWR